MSSELILEPNEKSQFLVEDFMYQEIWKIKYHSHITKFAGNIIESKLQCTQTDLGKVLTETV